MSMSIVKDLQIESVHPTYTSVNVGISCPADSAAVESLTEL